MKSMSTIRRHKKQLRALVETSSDPCVQRIAYAIETALTWASTDTVCWPTMEYEAITLAAMLRRELGSAHSNDR